MCCLLVCQTAKPTMEMVRKLWFANDDGAGVGFLNEQKKCEYIKGLNSVKETFDTIQSIKLPFVLHFRLQSAGGYSKLLTHPFEVTRKSELKLKGEANRLLFHNGTVSSYEDLLAAAGIDKPSDPCSDTRAIAMIISHNNEKFLSKINGKFVLLDSTCRKVKVFGDFSEDKEYPGILFSNTFWKYKGQNTNCYHGVCSGPWDEHLADWESEGGTIATGNKKKEEPIVFNGDKGKVNLDSPEYKKMNHAEREKFWNEYFDKKLPKVVTSSIPSNVARHAEPLMLPPMI